MRWWFCRKPTRCPMPACTEPAGVPWSPWLPPDFCPKHRELRANCARLEWIDPAALLLVPWSTSLGGDPLHGARPPCGACGHPRYVHAVPGYIDGPCLVPECTACDGEGDHVPGYQPSIPAGVARA
jgi:hypothetical protein